MNFNITVAFFLSILVFYLLFKIFFAKTNVVKRAAIPNTQEMIAQGIVPNDNVNPEIKYVTKETTATVIA